MPADDENHVDLLARAPANWMPTGLRHRILTPGTNISSTVHGAVNLLTGTVHHVSIKDVSVASCYFLRRRQMIISMARAGRSRPVAGFVDFAGGRRDRGPWCWLVSSRR